MHLSLALNLLPFLPDLGVLYALRSTPNFCEIHPKSQFLVQFAKFLHPPPTFWFFCEYIIPQIKAPNNKELKNITPDPNGRCRLLTKNTSKWLAMVGRPGIMTSLMKNILSLFSHSGHVRSWLLKEEFHQKNGSVNRWVSFNGII